MGTLVIAIAVILSSALLLWQFCEAELIDER